jgi:6-phosphogluconolactonase (cycloisomerase 2 family)
MHIQTFFPFLSILSTTLAKHPARLWATHYNGTVYTLSLNLNNDLAITQSLDTCGDMPSWLTLDPKTRTVYCSDETGTADPATHGSLTSLHVAPDGTLHEMAVPDAVGGGVNSVIYEADNGRKFIAIAH